MTVRALYPTLTLIAFGCAPEKSAPRSTGSKAIAEKAAPAPESGSTGKVVFDPKNPPAGYTRCHRNHCHKVGGGVASYAEVMKEIGATEIIGGAKPKPMPAAPPDVADPPSDAAWTDSGLASKKLKPGAGTTKPAQSSVVTAHYTGWTREGRGFDSSVARGEPATFPLARMFPGLQEGIQLMVVGEKRRFWVPENLAFQGKRGRPPGMVVFDVELLEIN